MMDELQYMGHTLSEKGISPDQLKITQPDGSGSLCSITF